MNVYVLPFKQQWMKYMHQSFFNPPISTLIKAINNNQLSGIPMMKADLVRKYLAPSPATSKGHMKQPRTGIQSTRPKTTAPSTNTIPATTLLHIPDGTPAGTPSTTPHLIQTDTIKSACNVFCYAALADKHQGTIYTDATGALPAVTLEGNQYYFDLKTKGYKPTFNITNNQATTPIKAYLKIEDCKWQFVEPNNHRVNAVECAIQTFKNHFISGLCSTDLTEQALLTLNLLCTSRVDPTKSAYHQLHGHRYDWNAYPLSKNHQQQEHPGATEASMHGIVALTLTTTVTANFIYRVRKHTAFLDPMIFSHNTASFQRSHQNSMLSKYTGNYLIHKPSKQKLLKKIAKALESLTTKPEQMVTSEGDATATSNGTLPIQRVVEHQPVTMSTNPTDPKALKAKPRTH
eukprot:CCRYP_014360-RA/>CCRYP_014360-RA protein AED:0.37 eAED:0.35 QI:0/0/0/1/0/0/3/0/403